MPFGLVSVMRGGVSRADVLRGHFAANAETIRPPYSVAEEEFRTLCERCDDCRTACQTGVIGRDSQGFPFLRFGQTDCSFCGACAASCATGALDAKRARAWAITAQIKATCMSFNGVTCRACEENCAEGAIRFRLMTGGRALPVLDEASCTGCGACATVCPNQSIEMTSRNLEEAFA